MKIEQTKRQQKRREAKNAKTKSRRKNLHKVELGLSKPEKKPEHLVMAQDRKGFAEPNWFFDFNGMKTVEQKYAYCGAKTC